MTPTFIQQDPGLLRRQKLAQAMMEQGSKYEPISHPMQGIAKLAQAYFGAKNNRSIEEEKQARAGAYNDTISGALEAYKGTPATTAPFVPDRFDENEIIPGEAGMKTAVPAKEGGMGALAQVLAGNPDTAPMGLQYQMQDIQNKRAAEAAERKRIQSLEDEKDLYRYKNDNAPTKLPAGMRMGANGPEYIPAYLEGQAALKRAGKTQVNVDYNKGGLSPGQEEIDKNFAKEVYVPFKTKGGFADARKQLGQLRTAMEALKDPSKKLTGPVVGLSPDMALAMFNPEAVDVRERVEEVVQRNLREVLGAQFTEKEGERLIARAYNPKLSQEVNADRLSQLIDQIDSAAKAKADAVQYFDEKGTLRGFEGKTYTMSDFYGAIEGGPDGEDLPAPQSDDEFNALPSGAIYIDPDDGKKYRKP